MAATLQEYLVSLGAEVDEKGIAKIHRALSTTKMAALGVTTALAAAVTMIAKTSVKLDETSQKYEQMARAQKKSTEEIRAQETALKVMGKTLKEVKADKVLNAQYEALLKVGKGLALPEASGGTLVLRDIISTIEELKVKGTYALQWINYHLLNKLYLPLSRLRDGLRNFSMKLSANFPSWMEKIATGLSYVVRLVGAGVEGVANLVSWIAQLPEGIKLVGAAISAAFSLSKLGPVGMTIAAITGLLLLLEDFYTWKNGTGPSLLGDFWQSISDGTLLSPEGVQTFLGRLDEVFGSVTEKVGQFLDIGTDITGKITEGIASFDAEAAGETLAGVVSKIVNGILGVVNGTNDTKIYNFAESVLTLVTTLFGKIVETIGSFIASAEWGTMLEGALTAVGNFLNNVFDLVFGKTKDGTEVEKGLAENVLTILTNFVTNIGDGIKKISFENLGEKVAAFMNELFGKIGELFKKEAGQDAPIKRFLSAGLDVIKNAITGVLNFVFSFVSTIDYEQVGTTLGSIVEWIVGGIKWAIEEASDLLQKTTGTGQGEGGAVLLGIVESLMNGIKTAFEHVKPEELGSSITTIVTSIISFIKTAFTNGLTLLIGAKNGETGEYQKGLLGYAKQIVIDIVKYIGEAAGSVSWADIGVELGTFVNGLFEKLGDFLESESSGETLLGTVATAAGKIVKGIVDMIASFFSSIDVETVKNFADDLWGAIQNAITDLSDRLTTDDPTKKIDTEGIGSSIGSAIGNVIKIGIQFLTKFCADAIEWITSPEGQEALQSIGAAIVEGIVAGMMAVGDAIGELIFGEEQWKEWQDLAQKQQAAASGEISSDEYTPAELVRMAEKDPEQFEKVAAESKGWTDWMRETNDRYGFPNANQWNIGWNMTDLYFKNSSLGFFPAWWEEWGKWNELKSMRDTAVENQDRASYEQAVAGLQAFVTGFKKGQRKDDLYASVDEAMSTVKVEGDNSQAQEAIEQTKESLDAVDGTTATTTIVTNHVDNYTTNGGNGSGEEDSSHTGHGGKFGMGGRFSSPTLGEIGEDDTEYLIPITKPSRARPLILQMFREMGSRANSILEDLGIPLDGTESLGGPGQPYYRQPAGMYPSAGGSGSVKSNSDNTVTAPTTINVYGGGDPERTGRAAAQASERNIVRRVRGCFEG